jgi:hypothetical protein
MHLLARAALLGAFVLAACSAPASSSPDGSTVPSTGSEVPSDSAAPSDAAPSASVAPSGPVTGGPVIVTFEVVDEEYRILITDPNDIAIALQLLAGDPLAPRIPNGLVVRGDDGGVNTGYGWHIDPESLEFADLTIEICDGRPSDVEAGSISGDRFCPWEAEVVSVDPA